MSPADQLLELAARHPDARRFAEAGRPDTCEPRLRRAMAIRTIARVKPLGIRMLWAG